MLESHDRVSHVVQAVDVGDQVVAVPREGGRGGDLERHLREEPRVVREGLQFRLVDHTGRSEGPTSGTLSPGGENARRPPADQAGGREEGAGGRTEPPTSP